MPFHDQPRRAIEKSNSQFEGETEDEPAFDETSGPPRVRPAAQPVTLAGIFHQSWEIYTKNLTLCLVASILDLLATALAILIATVLAFCTLMVLGGGRQGALLAAVAVWLMGITITYSVITVGNFRYYIALARGRPVRSRMLIVREASVGRLITGWLLFWVLAGVGILMMLVPGLLVMILLWPFAAIIVDRNVSVAVALRESLRMTTQNFGVSVGVFFAHIGLLALPGLVPGVGHVIALPLALPLAAVLHSVSYLHLSGEMTGGEVREERVEELPQAAS